MSLLLDAVVGDRLLFERLGVRTGFAAREGWEHGL